MGLDVVGKDFPVHEWAWHPELFPVVAVHGGVLVKIAPQQVEELIDVDTAPDGCEEGIEVVVDKIDGAAAVTDGGANPYPESLVVGEVVAIKNVRCEQHIEGVTFQEFSDKIKEGIEVIPVGIMVYLQHVGGGEEAVHVDVDSISWSDTTIVGLECSCKGDNSDDQDQSFHLLLLYSAMTLKLDFFFKCST